MNKLKTAEIKTPLGNMVAIVDEDFLYFLDFVDCSKMDLKLAFLKNKTKSEVVKGRTAITDLIEHELENYFAGKLKSFTTPLFLCGTAFQIKVWQTLQKIPFNKTISYTDLAVLVGKPAACRAVASANGANLLPVIIPCHRVISMGGGLGGYSSGLHRKEWLLQHEAK